MEDIGRKLRETREKLNLSFEEIYNQTRISIEHLRFLEENNFDFLPEIYVKAFLKTYAKTLRLDENEILNDYLKIQEEKRRAQEQEMESNSSGLKSPDTSKHLLEWSLGVGTFILFCSLIFVYAKYKSQIPKQPSIEIKEIPIEEFTAEKDTVNDHPIIENKENLVPHLKLQINVIEKVWLRLTIDSLNTTEYMLYPNQKLTLTAEKQFDMLVGNAGGIRFNFNGKEIGKIGESGVPMRLLFTKDGLTEKKQITNLNKPPL